MRYPDFYDAAPVIRTRDRLAELLGASEGGLMDYRYVDAVRLCGHSCPTVASAFLAARAALAALYPDGPAERGGMAVEMPAPEDAGTTGVVAQVMTLATGAAGANGFPGIGGSHRRKGLLTFAGEPARDGSVLVSRLADGAAAAVRVDLDPIPPDPALPALFARIRTGAADAGERAEFGRLWQDRVRRILIEHADDPEVVRVEVLEPV